MCIFSFFLTLFSSPCFWLRGESKRVSKLYYDEVTSISELNEIITVLIPRLWFLTALGNNKWIISFDTCFYFSFSLCSGLRTYFSLLQSKNHDILITLKMNVFHASKQLGTEQGTSLFKWHKCWAVHFKISLTIHSTQRIILTALFFDQLSSSWENFQVL